MVAAVWYILQDLGGDGKIGRVVPPAHPSRTPTVHLADSIDPAAPVSFTVSGCPGRTNGSLHGPPESIGNGTGSTATFLLAPRPQQTPGVDRLWAVCEQATHRTLATSQAICVRYVVSVGNGARVSPKVCEV
eukprot:8434954-Pyramimonas_sp.AAC.2